MRAVGGLPLWILSVFFSKNDIPEAVSLFRAGSGERPKMIKTRNSNVIVRVPLKSVDTESNSRETFFNTSKWLKVKAGNADGCHQASFEGQRAPPDLSAPIYSACVF